MTFDSYQASDSRNVAVNTDSTGKIFTVTLYLDPSAGTTDSSVSAWTDTISIAQVNTPKAGMLLGTVTRTGHGAGNGKVACIVNKSVDTRVICSGTSPSNNNYPYTVAFAVENLNVLGQPDTMSLQGQWTGLYNPGSPYYDGTRLFIPDSSNNRVLIWNTLPTASGVAANVVLGQVSLNFAAANANGAEASAVTAQGLSSPVATFSDGTKLFVVDEYNNRVLIWDSIPTANQTAADLVLGQPDMTSDDGNNRSNGAQCLDSPRSVYSDGTKLYVTDGGNNRVLIWNAIPSVNQAAANVVLGQPDMNANDPGTSASSLANPQETRTYGTTLYVADSDNNRVLVWNSIPAANGQAASMVIGQKNMAGTNTAVTSSNLNSPESVYSDGTKLYISDAGNQRVLIWNSIPTGNQPVANLEVGQTDFTSFCDQCGGTLGYTFGVQSYGSKLFITETSSSRLIIWNTIPTANNALVNTNVIVGQPFNNTYFGGADAFAITSQSFNDNATITGDGTRLYVVDGGNARVLMWNTTPTTNQQAASLVIGQPDFTSTCNGCGDPGLGECSGAFTDGTKLYVADTEENRIVIWNSIPTGNFPNLNVSFGHLQGLNNPTSVVPIGTRVYVADSSNNRILIWNFDSDGGPACRRRLGPAQYDRDGANNNGAGVSASSLSDPTTIYYDGTKFFVADNANNRVLIWNAPPTTNGTPANIVLGQSDMTSASSLAASATTVSFNIYGIDGVYSDGTKLYVADDGNNRVLVWNPIPTGSQTPASLVIGQPDMTSNTANNGGAPSTQGLAGPTGTYSDGVRLYISDTVNNRVLVVPVP